MSQNTVSKCIGKLLKNICETVFSRYLYFFQLEIISY